MIKAKGVDVSEWQETVDWTKVKADGIQFAIIRAGVRKRADKYFFQNVKGAKAAGVSIPAVYFFTYAKSSAEVKEEAAILLANIEKAGLPKSTIVFYDFEYDTVRDAKEKGISLGKEECILFTKTFCNYFKEKGYRTGAYANIDYYKSMYNAATLNAYDAFWLADYEGDADYPCQYHQYTSKGKVDGMNGYIDMNYFLDDTPEEATEIDLWTRTAELMAAQSGYLEKASNSNLDSMIGNAGYNNYTKYSRDVNNWGQPGCQGQPWCATYQFWICVKIFGLSKALQIMGGGFYNCISITNHAKANGTWSQIPKLGALVIFRGGAHIGRVTRVTKDQIYTNEGNTSSAEGVVANGGAVRDKVYSIASRDIDGYVHIDYGASADTGSTTTAKKLSAKPKWVGKVTATELNVRSWAGTESPLIKKWPKLAKGNLVDVCSGVKDSNGVKWYYIRIDGKYYGFVHSGYIERQ